MSRLEDESSREVAYNSYSSIDHSLNKAKKRNYECEQHCECGEKECGCTRKCLTAGEIICNIRNAVVKVQSEFILIGADGPAPDAAPSDIAVQPLAPNARADIILKGHGFFIKDHYIITPAHLVLLPPSLTSVANRYPFFNAQNLPGSMQNIMTRASRILVSIFNVNNNKHSFVYEADLVGVDGAGDIAVLDIDPCRCFNLCNPRIEKCHPYLKFGCSREVPEGEKVYLINDVVVGGLLSDKKYLEHSGWMLAEAISVSISADTFSSGAPIVDCQGRVIGMQTTNSTILQGFSDDLSGCQDFVLGPSEAFMHRIIKTIIKGKSCHKLEIICDPVGTYYRYRKAYLGLAYDLFTGVDYDTTTDYTSNILPAGVPRIRLDADGNFLNQPGCKELMGIRILGLAGLNPNNTPGVSNGLFYVPGGQGTTPLFADLPISGLLNKLQPGDVITHINRLPIGNLLRQTAPSLITWRLKVGEEVIVCYRRGGNFDQTGPNDDAGNYDNLNEYSFCVAEYPEGLDYPWYAVDIFPLLANNSYPGFIFGNQTSDPQIPQLLGSGGMFHPVI